jgi:hypothetical protein
VGALLELVGQQRPTEQQAKGDRQQGAERRDGLQDRTVAAGEGLGQDLAVAAGGDAGGQAAVAGHIAEMPAAAEQDQAGDG